MHQLIAKHFVDCFSCKGFDLLKFSCLDQILFHHPASATGDHLFKVKVFLQIICIDPPGGHKFYISVRGAHGFYHFDAASCLCGEKFNRVKPQGKCCFNITWISCSG